MSFHPNPIVPCGFLIFGLFLMGCNQNTAKTDLSELRDPLIRKAKAKADQGDREGALECLNQVLDKRPGLAQSHLDAGLLYDDYKKDYVRAVYHYQRYLELRPETEKRKMIQDLIYKARMSFAASVSDQLPGYSEKFKVLQDENNRLKNELREAHDSQTKQVAGAPAGTLSGAGAAVSPSPGTLPLVVNSKSRSISASPTGQVYRVQEHETLSMIAAKVYQNPGKWKLIYDANREILISPDKLRSGQVLNIPPR